MLRFGGSVVPPARMPAVCAWRGLTLRSLLPRRRNDRFVSGRRVAAVAVWWCALWGLWLAYQGEWNRIEWVAAACAATLGAGLAGAVMAVGLLRFRPPL